MPIWVLIAVIAGGPVLLILGALLAYAAWLAKSASEVERVPVLGHPSEHDLQHEVIIFKAADNVALCGWYIPAADDRACVILVQGEEHHRNSPGIRALELARDLTARGFSVFMFDLRARGESGGRHASAGNQELVDVMAALACVRARGIPPERTALHGFSLGAGLAILAAARESRLGALVCDSPFKDLLDDYQNLRLWGVPVPARLVVPVVRFMGRVLYHSDAGAVRPIKAAGSLRLPVLFIHGQQDEVVPPGDSEALYTACGSARKELWLVPGAAHVSSYAVLRKAYVDRVAAFLESLRA